MVRRSWAGHVDNEIGWDLELPGLKQARVINGAHPPGRTKVPRLETIETLNSFGVVEAPLLNTVISGLEVAVEIEANQDVLPALESVGDGMSLTLFGSTSATVTLPSLTTTGGLGLHRSAAQHVSLPQLQVAETLFIADMTDLRSIGVPSLSAMRKLVIRNTPMLSQCAVNDLIAQTNPSTTTIQNIGPSCP